jgi:hypothetical protein
LAEENRGKEIRPRDWLSAQRNNSQSSYFLPMPPKRVGTSSWKVVFSNGFQYFLMENEIAVTSRE